MALEGLVQRQIWLALASRASRLFRLNTGRAWISSMGPKGVRRLEDGSVHIVGARSIALGFADVKGDPVAGAQDLPGWTTITVTPEFAAAFMGRRLAIYTSAEAKRSKGGRATPEQLNWRDQVHGAGGIGIIAASPEEATQYVDDWIAGKIS